jgi:hypothetical protein
MIASNISEPSTLVQANTVAWRVIPNTGELEKKDEKLREQNSRLPDFFICGAAKSGTTSLFNYLGQHSSIFAPEQKEPGYFSALRPLESPYRYGQLFKEAGEHQYTVEASGAYLTSPDSALRISKAVPQAKIIIMLRNPADRAFSLYQWMIKEGYEWAPTFKDALRMEEDRRNSVSFVKENPEYFYNFLYRTSGCYARQVERFLETFDREQMRFLIFDDFVSSPASCTRKIFRFLGIDDTIKLNTPVRNEGRSAHSAPLQFWIRQRARPILRKIPLGLRIMRKAMQWNTTPRKGTLSDRFRQRLLQYYEEDIRETSALIGRDLASRWL